MLEKFIAVPANFGSQISSTTNPFPGTQVTLCMFCVFFGDALCKARVLGETYHRRSLTISDQALAFLENVSGCFSVRLKRVCVRSRIVFSLTPVRLADQSVSPAVSQRTKRALSFSPCSAPRTIWLPG